MLQFEVNLKADLDGVPCFAFDTGADAWTITFASSKDLLRARRPLKQILSHFREIALTHKSLLNELIELRVGKRVVGEVVPEGSTSLLMRILGLHVPGLHLRYGSIILMMLTRR